MEPNPLCSLISDSVGLWHWKWKLASWLFLLLCCFFPPLTIPGPSAPFSPDTPNPLLPVPAEFFHPIVSANQPCQEKASCPENLPKISLQASWVSLQSPSVNCSLIHQVRVPICAQVFAYLFLAVLLSWGHDPKCFVIQKRCSMAHWFCILLKLSPSVWRKKQMPSSCALLLRSSFSVPPTIFERHHRRILPLPSDSTVPVCYAVLFGYHGK